MMLCKPSAVNAGGSSRTKAILEPSCAAMMLRTIQVEKLALGLCVVIVYALLWSSQTMSAAKVTTSSGLQYVDLTVGNGDVAKTGDQVSVHYTGWLQKPDGSKGQKFDSSKDRGQPFQFPLGQGQVIKGWD